MSRTTVLYVDDDSNDVLLLQHACRKAGIVCDLRTAADGDEAITYLRGIDKYSDREQFPLPRLVVLDLKMPRVNGFEVLGWMRQIESFRRLPVVVLTSSNHEMDIKRAYDAGANSYLVKPVGFDALVDLVRTSYHYWMNLNAQPEI